jgi:hypothetical protein
MLSAAQEKALTDLVACYEELTARLNEFSKLTLSPCDSPLQNAAWQMFDAYTEMTAKHVGDEGEWLSWFIWINECGQNELEVWVGKRTRRIGTVKDLAWVLNNQSRVESIHN